LLTVKQLAGGDRQTDGHTGGRTLSSGKSGDLEAKELDENGW